MRASIAKLISVKAGLIYISDTVFGTVSVVRARGKYRKMPAHACHGYHINFMGGSIFVFKVAWKFSPF